MNKVSIYLNFPGTTEAAFAFYQKVFGTEYSRPLVRMGSIPQQPGQPPMPDDEKDKVMNVALPILGGLELMATDAVGERGKSFKAGNNFSINLQPDTRAEARRLFAELSAGGSDVFPLTEMFWGALWSSFVDQYGTRWMINCEAKE
ncbi:MAG TPA: VOC family protein [Candidatus Acidoferrum sp.]|nr:VOC family protein [Candidatus Acidoferrum sp.]